MAYIPEVQSLFAPLDHALCDYLEGLSLEQWELQTVAKEWKVKDVVAHLLDGNLRALSIQRDRYFGEKAPESDTYPAMVNWLNHLNADWVKAAKRLSPQVLLLLHRMTGPMVSEYYGSLDPEVEAIFGVAWAGQDSSSNAMHLAREYSEKWHHQQQIRHATGDELLLGAEWSKPFWETIMLGLPHALRHFDAENGTKVMCSIQPGGSWTFECRSGQWFFVEEADHNCPNQVEVPADLAWILFSKSIRPEAVMDRINIVGNMEIARAVLSLVAVMA